MPSRALHPVPLRGRTVFLLGAALAGGACSSSDGVFTEHITCSEAQACPDTMSCLVSECIDDGVLGPGDTCSLPQQCEAGLVCKGFTCAEGCVDVYYKDQCTGETWCKPIPGETVALPDGTVPAGECAPKDCDPSQGGECGPGLACMVITATVGACLPYCEYGFSQGAYFDTCTDDLEAGIDYACQPLGLTYVPVCMPSGGVGSPGVGVPGCARLAAGTDSYGRLMMLQVTA